MMISTSIDQPNPEPTSSAIGRDAHNLHDDHGQIAPGEIAIGVVIGRASEYFDYFVYGIA